RPDVEVTRVHRTAAGWPEEGAGPPPGRFRRRQGPTGEDGRRVAASLITRAKDPTHALHHPPRRPPRQRRRLSPGRPHRGLLERDVRSEAGRGGAPAG